MGKIMNNDELATAFMETISKELTLTFTVPDTDFDLRTVNMALHWLKGYIEQSEKPEHEFGAQDAHSVLSVLQRRYQEKIGYGSDEYTKISASIRRDLKGSAFDSLTALQSLCKLFYADEVSCCKVCGDHPSEDCPHANTHYIAAWRYHLRNLCEMTSPVEIVRYFKRTIGIDLSERGEHE